MPYCSTADLLEEIVESVLIELSDDADNPTGSLNQSAIDSAIARSDGIIDAYLGTRYTVPLTTVPEVVKTISVDLTIYALFTRRESLPDKRQDRYNMAISMLKRASEGECVFPTESATTQQIQAYTRDADFSDAIWETY